VRGRRDGFDINEDLPSARETGPGKPMLRDPVLVRALDLLKGLAMVRDSHVH
jgi:hypothetical protein